VLQTLAVGGIYGLMASPVLGGAAALRAFHRGALSGPALAGVCLLMMAAVWPLLLAISVAAKWTVIGRYRPGSYPLWGWYYLRCWLVRRLQQIALPGVMAGTPLLALYYRLMGARIGRHCAIDTPHCAIFDLLEIGDDASIGAETQLLGYRVEDGRLLIGSIQIGDRCFVGTHSALGLDTRMGTGARLGDLSLLPDGQRMAPAESRRGSPARPGPVPVPEPEGAPQDAPRRRPFLFGLLHLGVLYAVGLALAPAGVPGALLLWRAGQSGSALALGLAIPAAAAASFLALCLWIPVVKRLVLPRPCPGVHRMESALYLRKWASDLLLAASRALLRPLYTTIYLPSWLRLLGARIGRRAEISTVSQISPELTDIGEHSFFADGSMVGGRRLHRGLVQLAESRVGRRSFVGNSAILPAGTGLGDDSLLGCLSVPPVSVPPLSVPPDGEARPPDGSEWLGSPSFALPHRRRVEGYDARVTHEPTPRLVAGRLAVDALRILIPSTIVTAEVVGLGALASFTHARLPLAAWLLALPPAATAAAAAALACVVVTKKILVGTFRPTVKPLWSAFVWLNEAVNGAYETVAAPLLVPLLGTPYCAFWLRRLGCKIGRRAYLETTLFSEFDLVEVGDGAALNAGAIIQNHLFEDRIMKASHLRVGQRCSVGNMAVVLYDTEMQPGSSVGPLSLLMKGETVPAGTRWLGIPTAPEPARDPPAAAAGPEQKREARPRPPPRPTVAPPGP
jgi:non-ribosomal peptide synthetase-like protein